MSSKRPRSPEHAADPHVAKKPDMLFDTRLDDAAYGSKARERHAHAAMVRLRQLQQHQQQHQHQHQQQQHAPLAIQRQSETGGGSSGRAMASTLVCGLVTTIATSLHFLLL